MSLYKNITNYLQEKIAGLKGVVVDAGQCKEWNSLAEKASSEISLYQSLLDFVEQEQKKEAEREAWVKQICRNEGNSLWYMEDTGITEGIHFDTCLDAELELYVKLAFAEPIIPISTIVYDEDNFTDVGIFSIRDIGNKLFFTRVEAEKAFYEKYPDYEMDVFVFPNKKDVELEFPEEDVEPELPEEELWTCKY